MRLAARLLPGGGRLVDPAATQSGHDYQQAGKPEVAWDDTAAREQFIGGLVAAPARCLQRSPPPRTQVSWCCRGGLRRGLGLLTLVARRDVELV